MYSIEMKKIFDFMVAAYTLFLPQRYGEERIKKGIKALNILLIPNGLSLIFCIAPFINHFVQIDEPIISTICYAIIPGLIIGFSAIKYLETNYSDKYEYITTKYSKIPKVAMVFVVISHYFISIFLFCFCATFLL